MAEATPASDVSTDSYSISLEPGVEYTSEACALPGRDVETAPHAHALWLREVIRDRIGGVLADDTVGPDGQEASLKELQRVCAGAIGGLEFRNLRISAYQAQRLKDTAPAAPQEVAPIQRSRTRQILARLACLVTSG